MSATAARSPDSLLRDDGNSLQENYIIHDCAEAYVRDRLQWYEFDAHQYGIDEREDDESLTYDDRPDLRVTEKGEDTTLGYVEIKAKSLEHDDWYMILNKRHWKKYLKGGDREDSVFEGALNLDVPVWIFMCVIDDDFGFVDRECVIPVRPTVEIMRTFTAPDQNEVCVISDDWGLMWSDMIDDF